MSGRIILNRSCADNLEFGSLASSNDTGKARMRYADWRSWDDWRTANGRVGEGSGRHVEHGRIAEPKGRLEIPAACLAFPATQPGPGSGPQPRLKPQVPRVAHSHDISKTDFPFRDNHSESLRSIGRLVCV